MSVQLRRHVSALVADLAAEYGEVDVVGRRLECAAADYDALLEAYEAFGVVGGAGVRVRDDDGRLLLVRYEGADGWVDPGDGRRPGESYRACARRGVRQATGVDVSLTGLAQVHLLYLDDWTDRAPIPNPYLSFRGDRRGGSVRAGAGVEAVRWADEPPAELLYDELAEPPLEE